MALIHTLECDLDEDCGCTPRPSWCPDLSACRDPLSGMVVTTPDLLGRRVVVGWEHGDLRLSCVEKARADEVIRALHYSRSVVWASSVHFLVEYQGEEIGALQFGPAMNPQSGAKVVAGSTIESWIELNRMAFSAARPEHCGTMAIALALRMLRHVRPKVEWVQCFADERCGKFGAVYQAASFLYCGEHAATFYELDGEWFHKSAWNRALIDKRGWSCGPKIERFNAGKDRAVAHTFRQFRYIKCLTRRARKNLLLPVRPYPKPNGRELLDV